MRLERSLARDINTIACGRTEKIAVVGDAGACERATTIGVLEGFAFDAIAAFSAASEGL